MTFTFDTITFIILIVHLMINSFCAGAFFKNQDLELSVSSFIGILIYLVVGTELMICVGLWAVAEAFYSWITRVTQIVFWVRYYTGYYNKISARTLKNINEKIEYYKAQKELRIDERHFLSCAEFLNKKYGFDYAKYKEENKDRTIFDEDTQFFTIK